MGWLAWITGSRVGRAVGGAVVLLLAVLGVYTAGRREGSQRAKSQAKEADYEHAEQIRERKDDALRRLDGDTRPVDERLHDLDGFRD
jgi:hypothetical protein